MLWTQEQEDHDLQRAIRASLGEEHQSFDQEDRDLERAHRLSLGLPIEQSPPRDQGHFSQLSHDTDRSPPYDRGSASRFLKDDELDSMSNKAENGDDDEEDESFMRLLNEDAFVDIDDIDPTSLSRQSIIKRTEMTTEGDTGPEYGWPMTIPGSSPPHDRGNASQFMKDDEPGSVSYAAKKDEENNENEQLLRHIVSRDTDEDIHAVAPTLLSRQPRIKRKGMRSEEDGASKPLSCFPVAGLDGTSLREDTTATPLSRQPMTELEEMNSSMNTACSHESDDSSSTPRQGSFTGSGSSKHFRLSDCEDEDRQLILHFIMNQERPILPYYNAHSVHLDDPDKELENFDISMLLATAGNAALYDEALTALYGGNAFGFQDPRIMQWWMKRIGDNSTRKLRHMIIQFTEGQVPYRGFTIEDAREEKIWYDALSYFKPRQQLEAILLNFTGWTKGYWFKGHWHDRESWERELKGHVYHILLTFRGLHSAHIKSGDVVSDNDARVLETAMTLRIGETAPPEVLWMESITTSRGKKWSMA